jgi:hypothetical protein
MKEQDEHAAHLAAEAVRRRTFCSNVLFLCAVVQVSNKYPTTTRPMLSGSLGTHLYILPPVLQADTGASYASVVEEEAVGLSDPANRV